MACIMRKSANTKTSLNVRSLRDNSLRQLAEIGRVPPEQHGFFFESVRANVETACQLDGLVGGLATKRGNNLASASLTLYDALSNLTSGERRLLEATLSEGKILFSRISSLRVQGLEQTSYQLALLFCLRTGKTPPRFPHQLPESPSRGRRSGAVKNWIAQNFVYDLLISTTAAGGALTLEKNIKKGSLINAINILAPYLPDRLSLSRLSTSTLQRIKDACSRAHKTVHQLDRD
jgi:hypothetical protein